MLCGRSRLVLHHRVTGTQSSTEKSQTDFKGSFEQVSKKTRSSRREMKLHHYPGTSDRWNWDRSRSPRQVQNRRSRHVQGVLRDPNQAPDYGIRRQTTY
jgi:hypothetical protein